MIDFDLYELLGVDSSSNQLEIKKAYRALQKKCHPDIAGPAGHDMSIVLNDVYSLLSDPISRSAYDQEQAKLSEFKGYTGKPLYSTWSASENEQRAVFVDEVKCVGCLKCALLANKTFAIESVYGRARVIAQWADPEQKIVDAIQTCPVDCISIVERSNLAALEFLMSKQPRGNVGISTGGDVFAQAKKFQTNLRKKESKDSDPRQESRISAVQGIRSISSWWYWQSPSRSSEGEMNLSMTHIRRKSVQPNTETLRKAVAKLKSGENVKSVNIDGEDEYWTPMQTLPSPSSYISAPTTSLSKPPPSSMLLDDLEKARKGDTTTKRKQNIARLMVPLAMAAISATRIIESKGGEVVGNGLNDHIGGSMALEVVNSFEMQVVLAGITWFIIGMGIVGIFEIFASNVMSRKQ